MKHIELTYAKPNTNGITTDYEVFAIYNDKFGSWHLVKKEPWGFSAVIKPNGTFQDEPLARMVLAYIETEKGFQKISDKTAIFTE